VSRYILKSFNLNKFVMSTKEELTAAIQQKGNEIKDLKTANPPTLKDDLQPLIAELLALKVSYKTATGEDFDPPKPKKESKGAQEESKKEGPSKKDLNKEKRKAEKLAKRAEERGAQGEGEAAQSQAAPVAVGDDVSAHLYGDVPIIQSTTITDRVFRDLAELKNESPGSCVWVRARIHATRAVGKGSFLILRHRVDTVQAVMFQGEKISKAMVKYSTGLSLESVVDIYAEITVPEVPVQSTTIKNMELNVLEIHCVSRAEELPFIVDDAGRNDEAAKASGMPVVNPDTCLNFRWIDLRTPANQAIFRIQSGVCQLFREYLIGEGFIEIHTPKLIAGASEGGANVFQLQYFGNPACLAQSPQLYKQMVCCGGGFDRVFEIGPVFRAENSNTHRLVCVLIATVWAACNN
jgi:aspartyl-tRNA synthetase